MFAVSLPSGTGKKRNPSIIDMANAAYSRTSANKDGIATTSDLKLGNSHCTSSATKRNYSASSTNLDERLDAARAMLGISPSSVIGDSVESIMGGRGRADDKEQHSTRKDSNESLIGRQVGGSDIDEDRASSASTSRRPRSNSAGLEALAFLATQEQHAAAVVPTSATIMTETAQKTVPYSSVSLVANPAVTSSDDDSEIMPPPPPRTTVTRRRRSVSNPEGMDKWGLPPTIDYNKNTETQAMRRLRLVLPVSILEEEMAEANAAVIAKEKSTASASALAASLLSQKNKMERLNTTQGSSHLPLVEEDDEDEEDLDHDELLRRARSRLLEDLSQSNLSGEKGVLILPHSLGKYKEVRNNIQLCRMVLLCMSANIMHYIRFITKMGVLEFIHQLNERQLLLDFKANGRVGSGIKRFDITVGKTLPIED